MLDLVIIYKIIGTFLAALFFGAERQRHNKPIGFGTFTFVSLGACSLGITAVMLYPENPLTLLSAIVTGIGFLGAGAMIKTNDKIMGATTAASIWLFAIFGLTVGVGNYEVAALIYASVWVVIYIDRKFESLGIGLYQRKLTITTNRIVNESEIREILSPEARTLKIESMDINKKERKMVFRYVLAGTKDRLNQITKELFLKDWFEDCKVE